MIIFRVESVLGAIEHRQDSDIHSSFNSRWSALSDSRLSWGPFASSKVLSQVHVFLRHASRSYTGKLMPFGSRNHYWRVDAPGYLPLVDFEESSRSMLCRAQVSRINALALAFAGNHELLVYYSFYRARWGNESKMAGIRGQEAR